MESTHPAHGSPPAALRPERGPGLGVAAGYQPGAPGAPGGSQPPAPPWPPPWPRPGLRPQGGELPLDPPSRLTPVLSEGAAAQTRWASRPVQPRVQGTGNRTDRELWVQPSPAPRRRGLGTGHVCLPRVLFCETRPYGALRKHLAPGSVPGSEWRRGLLRNLPVTDLVLPVNTTLNGARSHVPSGWECARRSHTWACPHAPSGGNGPPRGVPSGAAPGAQGLAGRRAIHPPVMHFHDGPERVKINFPPR